MDSSFDLPDSTDWIKTSLPAFEPLEAALRCEVCKEFYHNPVITSCSHTFCSICIRRCIASDGKCPSCKTGCSSDKLAPNIAVREVVMRFQEARPKALELARADKDEEVKGGRRKKRKIEDTDIEEDDNVRHTRSRQTRSKSQRNGGRAASPAVVADSEDGDEDFVPDGMVKCPVCNRGMKEELVYNHLDTCTGPNASPGRNTRPRIKPAFPALQTRKKDPSPPPTRLSQLNYAMMKETALRKKLQEIGIPNWGTKDLMKRRHIEWINIFNSNCDAHDSLRKSHRQLLKELDEWEQTQGGKSNNKESAIMRKDFDGEGYAKSHRTEFEDLIARARQKRATSKTDDEYSGQNTPADGQRTGTRDETTANGTDDPSRESISNHASPDTLLPGYGPHNPSEDGQSAPATMPAKGEAANSTSTIHTLKSDNSMQGKEIPLGSPSRQVPIYAVPEKPVKDMEGNAAVQ